ncbi:PorV/PorQ family protein [Flammeovirga sp. MY04]|uniref:putative type IX sorting system protein PorV2 n=1 Tax=Flammeovirga sp. MY04 TaxID=1191459 RepID=UPI00080632AC|nr:PorV/PorQ family protein [Flammeovirga sp. MY04]ANQ49005.1 PorV/PorQ family protein [Flammeovirga sp. MY04]
MNASFFRSYLNYSTLTCILIFITVQSQAQINAPKYVNEYLAIGVGARGLAMGNAQTETVNDATAGYWNPAGLLNLEDRYSVSLMHAEYFAGIAKYDFAGFATKIDNQSALGISFIRFGVDDIPDTRYLFDPDGSINWDNVQSFSSADYAFLFSYARQFPKLPNLQFGANAKVIYRHAGQFANAWGFGLDMGLQWKKGRWQVGVTAKDITGTYNVWAYNPATFYDIFKQTGNTIPENSVEVATPRLIVGGARNFAIWKDSQQEDAEELIGALVSFGADITFDGKRNTVVKTDLLSIDPRMGVEFHYKKMVFLRGGISQFQYIKEFNGNEKLEFLPSFGAGFAFKGFVLDYALTNIGDISSVSLYSHVFSLKVDFGRTLKRSTNAPKTEKYY